MGRKDDALEKMMFFLSTRDTFLHELMPRIAMGESEKEE